DRMHFEAVQDDFTATWRVAERLVLAGRDRRIIDNRIGEPGPARTEPDQPPRDELVAADIVEALADVPADRNGPSERVARCERGEVAVVHPALEEAGTNIPHELADGGESAGSMRRVRHADDVDRGACPLDHLGLRPAAR